MFHLEAEGAPLGLAGATPKQKIGAPRTRCGTSRTSEAMRAPTARWVRETASRASIYKMGDQSMVEGNSKGALDTKAAEDGEEKDTL